MNLKRLLIAATIAVGTATSAAAADIPMAPPAPPPPPPAPAFEWSGAYIGVYGGYNSVIPPGTAGALLGYNFTFGTNFLAGVDVRVGAFFPGVAPIDFYGLANARVGWVAGDNVLLYGIAGVGYVPVAAYLFWSAGGGIEVAVGSNMSIFGEVKAENCFGCGFPPGLMLRAGLNWHFGN